MKNIFLLSVMLGVGIAVTAQKPAYDSLLAKKLNADPYGMKKYVLVILKTGTIPTLDKPIQDSLFAGHMKNIDQLAKKGKLIVAGPMGKNEKNYRGIFILNTTSIEEAKIMVESDPAVKGQLLAAEYFSWYGSAALQETLLIHERIQQKSF